MKKTISILGTIIGLLFINCANNHPTASVLLKDKGNFVHIYNFWGEKTDSIINDTITENYVFVEISRIHKERAKVEVQYALNGKTAKGWIELKHLGINPATTENIYLYKYPFCSAIQDSIVNPYWGDLYSIEKKKGEWLYIHDGVHEGWMEPKDQCPNPYTTCN